MPSTASVLRDTVDRRRERTPELGGLFVAIGNDPRTHLVHGQLDLTPEGTIAVGRTLVARPARPASSPPAT